MKIFTKISLIVLITLFCLQLNAQTFRLKAGLNLSKMLFKDNDENYDLTMNHGFHIGAIVDMPFNEFLSFESGLLFTTKGYKYEYKEGFNLKVKLHYLDIPLTLKASRDLWKGFKIFGTAGPYVGIGLSGKAKGTIEGVSYEDNITWGSSDEDDLKRFEWGLTFGGGVEINSIIIGISYDLGLSNISANQDNGTIAKNKVLKFSIGYIFGK